LTLTKKRTSVSRRDSRRRYLHEEEMFLNHRTEFKNNETSNYNPQKQRKQVVIKPKTQNQHRYVEMLRDDNVNVVVAGGPAGTGKSFLAILSAIESLREKKVDKIILCRPAVAIENEEHGFFPGSLSEKLAPWCVPMLDILKQYYHPKEIDKMVNDEIIEFAALGMMRGRNLINTVLVCDESQNSTPTQMKALLTRIGENSKFIINGDVNQSDRFDKENGLLDLLHRLNEEPINGVEVCQFDERDIQRHRLVGEFIKLYKM
jgi:phosphate starvation-inducible protein PhoH and related proteins